MAETDNVVHKDKTFTDVDFSERTLLNREFIKCRFSNCNFANSDLSNNDFVDCQFTNCNFAMTKMNNTGLSNILFTSCKTMGIDFSACNRFMFSFRFDKCLLDYSTFVGAKLKSTRFTDCSLKEVDFERADLSSSIFSNCDLSGASFNSTNLEKADFTTARYFSIDPANNKMTRAKFSNRDLAGLLEKYKLDINFD